LKNAEISFQFQESNHVFSIFSLSASHHTEYDVPVCLVAVKWKDFICLTVEDCDELICWRC